MSVKMSSFAIPKNIKKMYKIQIIALQWCGMAKASGCYFMYIRTPKAGFLLIPKNIKLWKQKSILFR